MYRLLKVWTWEGSTFLSRYISHNPKLLKQGLEDE